MMGGKLILNIGYTGTGKSSLVKSALRGAKLAPLIFDINNEYNPEKEYFGPKSFAQITDVKKFVKFVEENVGIGKQFGPRVVVIDEATIFFNSRMIGKEMQTLVKLLVLKRHSGNTYILNFHSISSVPVDILAYTNEIFLFKTNDRPDLVEKKYKNWPDIFNAFWHLRNSKNFHERIKITLF